MPEEITKPATVKGFLKGSTSLRVGEEAITAMFNGINQTASDIVKKADSLCQAENRTTILDRDINQAFNTIGGGVDNSPEGIFKAVEKMEPEDIGKISIMIAQWVKEHRASLEG